MKRFWTRYSSIYCNIMQFLSDSRFIQAETSKGGKPFWVRARPAGGQGACTDVWGRPRRTRSNSATDGNRRFRCATRVRVPRKTPKSPYHSPNDDSAPWPHTVRRAMGRSQTFPMVVHRENITELSEKSVNTANPSSPARL